MLFPEWVFHGELGAVAYDAGLLQHVRTHLAKGHSVVATSLSLSGKKLLVHIDASVDQLRALPLDIAALHASHAGSDFKGVIVTIAGGKLARHGRHLWAASHV